ncbi:MAG: enoyl-CoA hydratase/isomerase family protein [Oscillospiraceae bacterium]|jgi:2-(1,2-epoxy-1,2-dihydrophenyl)acetyl-CoA isomerase
MDCKQIGFQIKDRLATIILDDKESANALSEDVISELAAVLERCEFDDAVGAVLIRGANNTFCSGGNIRAMQQQAQTGSYSRLALGRLGDAAMRLKNMSKPTICAIEGACAGAGMSLAMACDFSIAREDAKFTFAFINLALVPDMGGTALLVKSAGVNKAKELMLGGGVFLGTEAAQWGIITKAVPADRFEEQVEKTCQKLLATAPVAYSRIKTMINRCAFPGFDAGLQNEMEYQYASYFSKDHVEGVNAFLEKRRPKFGNQ